MTSRLTALLSILLLGFLAFATDADAQVAGGGDSLRFGPPLRSDFVFAWKYTERVTTHLDVAGRPFDSSERVLSYYITQRQIPFDDGSGRITLEVNVDSMQVDYRSSGDSIRFHTQHLVGDDWKMVRHNEVLVPSALVNRVVRFTLSPYGEILSSESRGLDDTREQAKNEAVDPFTRGRVMEMTDDSYIATVMLPWRGMLPLGRTVAFGRGVTLPKVYASLDRVAFASPATVTAYRAPDNLPHVRFESRLEHPTASTVTWPQFLEPLKVVAAEGRINGDMTVEEDGVVSSGWSSAKGTITADRNGEQVVARVEQTVVIEPMGAVAYSPVFSN